MTSQKRVKYVDIVECGEGRYRIEKGSWEYDFHYTGPYHATARRAARHTYGTAEVSKLENLPLYWVHPALPGYELCVSYWPHRS
jgi:hypothetical protein